METEQNKAVSDLNAALDLIENVQWAYESAENPYCPWCGASANDLDDTHHIHVSDCSAALFLRAHGRDVQIADPEAEKKGFLPAPEQTICFFQPGSFPAEEGPVDLPWLVDLATRALKNVDSVEICIIERAVRITWPPAPELEGLSVPVCCVDLEPYENGYAFKIRGKLGYMNVDDSAIWARLSGAPVFALPWNMEMLMHNTAWKIAQAAENMGRKLPWKKSHPCTYAPGPMCSKGAAL